MKGWIRCIGRRRFLLLVGFKIWRLEKGIIGDLRKGIILRLGRMVFLVWEIFIISG